MFKTRKTYPMSPQINGISVALRNSENGRNGRPVAAAPVQKEAVHSPFVIELSSSSENEEDKSDRGRRQTAVSANPSENTMVLVDMKSQCWNGQGERSINMLRRDYGKRAPCRTFQVPVSSPKNNNQSAGQEEFYKYLGIYSKPPFAKAVDMSTDFIKRRSLRMCFLKKWKEHRAKLAELESRHVENVENNRVSPTVAAKNTTSPDTAELSPASSHSSGRTMERWDYIQITNSASDEENLNVKHKVYDLSHSDKFKEKNHENNVGEKSKRDAKTDQKKRKTLRKNRKRFGKKIYHFAESRQKKYKYFIRSAAVSTSLRSGKVRDANLQKNSRLVRLRKEYKKKKEQSRPRVAQEIPTTKATLPTKPLVEVIVLTDDDDMLQTEQTTTKPEETTTAKFLDENLGQVVSVYVSWPSLVIIQDQIISFWSCSRISKFFNEEQKWAKEGEIRRKTYHEEIPADVTKRIINTVNFGCVYLEMRGNVLDKIHTQGRDYTATYINIYYLKNKEGVIHSIELDRTVSLPKEVCYTTLPDLPSLVVTWYEHTSPIKRRTSICRYSLTPDLETLASIWDFSSVDNHVRSLSVSTEQRVVGIGDHHVSIWNYSNGNLLTNIEFPLELGANLFCHLEHDNKRRFIFLTHFHANTIQTVAINLLDFQYFILHTHENVNLSKDALSSSAFTHGVFVAAFNTGELLLLKAHQSEFLKRKTIDRNTNIYLCNEHVVEINDKISVKSWLDLIM